MFTHFRAEGTEAGLDLDIEVEPGKQVYCFFGRNGSGKTVLLETLGRTLLLAHSMFCPHSRNWTPSTKKFVGLYDETGVGDRLKGLDFRMPTEARIDDTVIKGAKEPWLTTDLERWSLDERPYTVDRPVVAVGARDRGFTENLAPNSLRLVGARVDRFVEAYLRTYSSITRAAIKSESLAEWFAGRVLVNPVITQRDDRSFEVDTMLQLMEGLDPKTFSGITKRGTDGSLGAISYADGKLWLGSTPFDKLPSGFIAIMKLFQEILSGYGGWTAFTGEKDLGQIDGIVLIDEIDAHVHPAWQANILPLLRRHFPRTTFYVCTHSPLIVSTTEAGEAYELVREGRRVTAHKLGNPRDWYLADLCEVAFHVTPPPVDDVADLPNLLLDFSIQVKDYLGTKDPARRVDAEALYQRIVPSVPDTDPRRRSLDSLRDMLR